MQNLGQVGVTFRNVRLANWDGSPYTGAEFRIEEDTCSLWPYEYLGACRVTVAFTGATAGANPVAALQWDTSPHATFTGDAAFFQIHGVTNTF